MDRRVCIAHEKLARETGAGRNIASASIVSRWRAMHLCRNDGGGGDAFEHNLAAAYDPDGVILLAVRYIGFRNRAILHFDNTQQLLCSVLTAAQQL